MTLEVKNRLGKRIVPLELKTGKTTKGVDHQGQVCLDVFIDSIVSLLECCRTALFH